MRRKYKNLGFKPESLERIRVCNDIIDSYIARDIRMTLRQLYYQLVARAIIPNLDKEYKNLSSLVSNARLAGLMDWEAIEDRARQPFTPSEWDTLEELVESAVRAFRLPRWEGQESYAELWVEKDALASVLRPLAEEYHVTLQINRGYSSQSAMFEAANRFIAKAREHEGQAKLFYLGDLDPSGEDMVRDVGDRLEMFLADVGVVKIALTMDQVDRYKPPPNPTKHTDSRSAGYIAKYGGSSWEVDALNPDILEEIIRAAFDAILDTSMMDEIKEREKEGKKRLRDAAKGM